MSINLRLMSPGVEATLSGHDQSVSGFIAEASLTTTFEHRWTSESSWLGALQGAFMKVVNDVDQMANRIMGVATGESTSAKAPVLKPLAQTLKKFNGTTANFAIPDFTVYFMSDNDGLAVSKVEEFLGKFKSLVGNSEYSNYIEKQTAPCEVPTLLKYDGMEYPGTLVLTASSFSIGNLVPTKVVVESSIQSYKTTGSPAASRVVVSLTPVKELDVELARRMLFQKGVVKSRMPPLSIGAFK